MKDMRAPKLEDHRIFGERPEKYKNVISTEWW